MIFDALKEGAFDFVDKPRDQEIAGGYERLISMIRGASLADHLKLAHLTKGSNTSVHTFEATLHYDIVVIGASTGGPSAVELIVSNLPRNLSIPVVIVQHMPERFIESFAARLKEATGSKVSVARNGERLLNNHIYLAPGTSNLRIGDSGSGPSFLYVDDHYKEYNHPSINCVMESVASVYGRRAIGVIMTGMGSDGAAGLKKIREAGGLTISQDEPTSVVYGMPRTAKESGASMYQIPVTEIPNFIISAL
jgi:two-component system, chemotaxis family, protein-glutamate methylesterase/glutaminase